MYYPGVTMKFFLIWLVMGTNPTAAATHSLKYFHTGSSGIPNFPEYISVGLADDVQIVRYDSITKKAEPKQDWMTRVTEDDPDYWESQTDNSAAAQQYYKANIETAKQRFNQTGGVHVLQNIYGCEWDEETGQVTGFYRFGYDGEDLISLDQKMESWIAPKQEAVITKMKLDHDKAFTLGQKHYYTQICPEWVKKYVNYGRSSLMRTDPPSVSLLQKSSSSPVSCHATGFYPNRAEMFWRKDGEEFHEGVDKGEIVPNNDGTFQMTVDLHLPPSEDWTKYECVFQLAGVDQDIVTKLEKVRILSNEAGSNIPIIAIVVVLVVLLVAVVVGLVLYKKVYLPQKSDAESQDSKESQETKKELLPKA